VCAREGRRGPWLGAKQEGGGTAEWRSGAGERRREEKKGGEERKEERKEREGKREKKRNRREREKEKGERVEREREGRVGAGRGGDRGRPAMRVRRPRAAREEQHRAGADCGERSRVSGAG
jgi:hypothetical protein